MGTPDEQIDEQMAADSATYDNPAPVEPPKKPSLITSAREKINEMASASKAKFEQHQAEHFKVQTIEKEAREAAEFERKEINLAQKYESAYDKELHKKSLAEKLSAAKTNISNLSTRLHGFSGAQQRRAQPPQRRQPAQMFGGMGSREPDYGSAVGHSFGGGVPLVSSQRPQRMAKSNALKMVPLISPMPHLIRRQTHPSRGGRVSSTSTFPPLMGKVGKMPSLFGPMKKGKRKGWTF